MKLLVDEGYCRVDIVDKDGWTAAVYAIMYVHFDVYTQLPRVLLVIICFYKDLEQPGAICMCCLQ